MWDWIAEHAWAAAEDEAANSCCTASRRSAALRAPSAAASRPRASALAPAAVAAAARASALAACASARACCASRLHFSSSVYGKSSGLSLEPWHQCPSRGCAKRWHNNNDNRLHAAAKGSALIIVNA